NRARGTLGVSLENTNGPAGILREKRRCCRRESAPAPFFSLPVVRDRLRRRLLVFAIVALAAMIAVPTVMGWKLIAAYAGMRHEEADPEATISLLPSETMSSAAGPGIAVARDGSIAVADLEGGRLLFYPAASPRVARVLAGPPRGRALIGWAVAFTPEGAIAIVEDSTGLVHFFDRSGTLLRKVKMTDS